jgi:serine protease
VAALAVASPATAAAASGATHRGGGLGSGKQHTAATAAANNTLYSRGGSVMTGAIHTYVVFWGSGWGTETATNPDLTFANDAQGAAPVVQEFLKGLGTKGETWSGVMTQYCQGVASGTSNCPAGVTHVGYAQANPLAGVWYDTTSAASGQTADIEAEVTRAAAHFGNPATSSNQIVILTPHGVSWDNEANWCAWHAMVSGQVYDYIPYQTDSQCWINNSGAWTKVISHEYAEALTDPDVATGWYGSDTGHENSDECNSTWGPLTLVTGTFQVQPTWSNDANACSASHPIVTGNPPTPTGVVDSGTYSWVNERTGPGLSYSTGAQASNNQVVNLVCKAVGDAVSGPVHSSDTTWWKLDNSLYISDAFITSISATPPNC